MSSVQLDKVELMSVGNFNFASLRCHLDIDEVYGVTCFVTRDYPGDVQCAVPVLSVVFEGAKGMINRLMGAYNSGKAVRPRGSK